MTAKPLIRIVDDDSDVCDSLSCLLSLEGWEIRIYTDRRFQPRPTTQRPTKFAGALIGLPRESAK